MILSMSDHIMKRYRERINYVSDDNIRQTIFSIYNSAEIVATYEDKKRTIIIKVMDNLVVVGCLKGNMTKLLTCFYDNNIERFKKMDSGIRELICI